MPSPHATLSKAPWPALSRYAPPDWPAPGMQVLNRQALNRRGLIGRAPTAIGRTGRIAGTGNLAPIAHRMGQWLRTPALAPVPVRQNGGRP